MDQLYQGQVFAKAVRWYWDTRLRQAAQQAERGVSDQGTRAEATGGRHMDEFVSTLTDVLVASGVAPEDIYARSKSSRELPGFFRPTKEWDFLVITEGRLRVAIELKSQAGPSFGNNFNNRVEEALGNADDIWTAYRENAFGAFERPWLGYLFLLEDCRQSQTPVRVVEPHFEVFPEFRGASYARRYELFCRKLVLERKYSAACFLMAERTSAAQSGTYSEPANDLAANHFLEQLIRHVRPL